eukprot:1190000-Prorocentrum_minimum.AAC.3
MGFSGPYNMVHSAPRYVVVIPNRAVSLPSHRPQLAHYAVAGVAQGLPEGGGQGTTRTSKGALKTERLQIMCSVDDIMSYRKADVRSSSPRRIKRYQQVTREQLSLTTIALHHLSVNPRLLPKEAFTQWFFSTTKPIEDFGGTSHPATQQIHCASASMALDVAGTPVTSDACAFKVDSKCARASSTHTFQILLAPICSYHRQTSVLDRCALLLSGKQSVDLQTQGIVMGRKGLNHDSHMLK